jgi:predicted house-cleaning NTP pyrophosphatase (Maf/HAM1 superfamily)
VQIVVSTFAEDLSHDSHTPASYVVETARAKGREVSARLTAARKSSGEAEPTLIISADTVVEIDDRILEKPSDDDDAIRMLTR